MVKISKNIYALKSIWDMDFEKKPLASFYNEYPFLIFNSVLSKDTCNWIINSLKEDESYKAKLISKGLDESVRKTTLHQPTNSIRKIFEQIINSKKEEIERFFNVLLTGGSEIQILEYKNGGFYKRHADNASEIYKNGTLAGYKLVAPQRKITTLLFLNEDFEGGEIEFCHLRFSDGNRVIYKPKAGQMIVFPSHGLFAHEVKKVEGKRFAAVKWWSAFEG